MGVKKIKKGACELVQKEYKTKHNWVGAIVHRELCKRLKFDHAYISYLDKPDSELENDTHKILWVFEI